ncbi:translocation/assembly module TamB domain-containing protein [Microbacter margulisiae]|uniref:Translocation and assembly module TamB C-terminal domain-containing protein n=1 Tax=Microbacter margulisiae TaxID=1350067 RepID=A0A7W5DU30_9PORP|nr:translocation/assembly module TamB domain-containing protein [Microbacter margulisiae]MBB3188574.1 hypothetical protein [Microbacter margulisiae]
MMLKSKQKIPNLALVVIAIIVYLFIFGYILLNMTYVQNVVRKQIVSELSETLHTRVDIAQLSFRPFSHFILKGLYLEDQQRDTLLYVHQVNVRIDFWKLFARKVSITEADMNQFDCHLRIDSTGQSNLAFVLKAFASKDTIHGPMKISFHVSRFKLDHSRFRLTDARKHQTGNHFSLANMDVDNLHLDMSLKEFSSDTLVATIHSLGLKERSGFQINNLQTVVVGNSHRVFFPRFLLEMPKSALRLDSVSFRYGKLSNLSDFVNKVRLKCRLLPSNVILSDLSGFVPAFKGYDDEYKLSTRLEGTIADIKCNDLKITNKNNFKFDGNFEISGLPNINDAFVYANVKQMHLNMAHLQDIIADLTNKPFMLPVPVMRLGTIYFSGSLTGFLSEMVAYGNVSTRLGNLRTDLKLSATNQLRDFSYSGTLSMNGFQLGAFLNNPQIGNVTLRASGKGSSSADKPMVLKANATVSSFVFRNYLYKNILFDASVKNRKFDGTASIHDPNVTFNVAGLIDWNKSNPMYQFTASFENFKPYALHLTPKWKNLAVSMQLQANLEGDLLGQAKGALVINQLSLDNGQDRFVLPLLKIEAHPASGTTNEVLVSSNLINGKIEGHYNLSKIGNDLSYLTSLYLPSLFSKGQKLTYYNDLTWNFTLDSVATDRIGTILNLPVQLHRGGTIQGSLNSKENQFKFTLDVPDATIGKSHLTNMHFVCDNQNKKGEVNFNAMLLQRSSILNVYANFVAANDSLRSSLSWDNNKEPTFAGELVTQTNFLRNNNQLTGKISILPTQIMVNDSVWNMLPCDITTDFHTFWINHFGIERHLQHLYLSGAVSSQPSDSLNVDLLGIHLEDVSDLIKLESPRLNGSVNGKVTVFGALQHPVANANLVIHHFGLNNADWGDNYVTSHWDGVNNILNASVKVYNKNTNSTLVTMSGNFYPSLDSLAFNGTTNHLSIDFLNPYLCTFLASPKGTASGPISLFLKDRHFWIVGDQFVNGGQAGLSYLNTTYTFNDTIHLRRGSIFAHDLAFKDQEGHEGHLALLVRNTDLKDWHYDVKVQGNNLLGLNTTENNNSYFWGKAYASGTVHVYDEGNTTHIDVNATSQSGTNMVFSVDNSQSSISNTFITYVTKSDYHGKEQKKETPKQLKPTDTQTIINTTFNITPEAHVELLIDRRAGDRINAIGSGLINVWYNTTSSDLQMFGNYTVNSGNYLFTFQNALFRDFKIDNGSKIRWDGSAMNPTIDINATYQVNASLADLMDADLLKTTNRTSVLVNCLLNLTGNLLHPDIKFDIELPNARDELKREVKNIINTDEMMNRQIIYLLAFGRFYTPDYMRTSTNSLGQNELLSVATSTLSSQLNNWLSQAVKGLNLGLNWNRSGLGSLQGNDYEAAIQYQNNRWIINGNLGYRDDNFSATKFIGDLDIQYLFSQNGKWSVRAYNHTNDYKELNPSLYTQGIGLTYTENFSSFDELFVDYWETFKKLFDRKINSK